MFQLIINGREVRLADGTKFTLKRENPLLTDGGDYSLTVNVPLDGSNYENRRTFGLLHRPETPKLPEAGRRYHFSLVAPPLSLSGYAILQEVTNKEARLQLRPDAAALTRQERTRQEQSATSMNSTSAAPTRRSSTKSTANTSSRR